MSEELKYYIDTFDVSLLSSNEQEKYNMLIDNGENKRIALFKMINNIRFKSYYLIELEYLIKEYDLNIEEYE